MKSSRILIASNAAQKRLELRAALECEGGEVSEAATAGQTMQQACSGLHDVLVLDSSIGGIGPFELCRSIRPKSDLGIILIDRDDTDLGSIDALNAGADDYVPAPFVLAELLARVRAILRRVSRPGARSRRIVLEDRTVDLQSHEIRGPYSRVSHLTPKEFLLLQHLATHANHPRTHQNLAQAIWQRDGNGEREYMRIVIGQLRRKLEPDPDRPRYILTERSVGYRFKYLQARPAVGTQGRLPMSRLLKRLRGWSCRNDSRATAP